MCCIHRRPLHAAFRAILHTVVMVLVAGAFGTFEMFDMFGDVAYAAGGRVARSCSELLGDRQLLRVRLVPAKSVTDGMMQRVQTEVVELWRPYGIDIVFEGRWDENNPESTLDLFVHFVDRELTAYPRRGAAAVAWILFLDGTPQHTVNVSVAAANRLLRDSPWLDARPMRVAPIDLQEQMIATMIGRALAHEIGHFLLGSSRHATDGLMRPMIPPAEFVRPGRRHLKLMPEDVQALRQARSADCQLSASR